MCERADLSSVFLRYNEKKKKKTYLPDDHSIPRRATLNISCVDFIIACSCSHSGIVGKVCSASMVFGHHCISYGLPAVLFRLACLSQLSTVEKDTDIETYKKKQTDADTDCSLQNSSVARPFGGRNLNCCYRGWPENSWQRAVCLSADRPGPFAQAGGQTDGGSALVMSGEKHLNTNSFAGDRAPPI